VEMSAKPLRQISLMLRFKKDCLIFDTLIDLAVISRIEQINSQVTNGMQSLGEADTLTPVLNKNYTKQTNTTYT
jgi:hypothetical protein